MFEAAPSQMRNNIEEKPDAPQHKSYGKVPQYINKFNKQREDAIKQKVLDEENSKLPPGTRLMLEDERKATLEDLVSAKRMTNDQLERLPITA